MKKDNQACLICGRPLAYTVQAREMTCAVCGQAFPSNAACEAGHYVCDRCHSQAGRAAILLYCQDCPDKDPIRIAQAMMDLPSIHMHGPEHHVLVGAALLCAYHNCGGAVADYPAALDELGRRGQRVPGGICGLWGCCGAAVSAGIFLSVAADATPMAGQAWGLANQLTAACLEAIGQVGGPRCCKRDSFLAIRTAVDFCRARLGVSMPLPGAIRCTHSARNRECLGRRCPFSPAHRAGE